MLFYRKKILLAILEAFGRPIEGVKFQKYLFLISEQAQSTNTIVSYPINMVVFLLNLIMIKEA